MTNVIVTVIGSQRDGAGDEQSIELITAGRHYRRNGVDYITYDESKLTGLEGTTTLLKLYDGYVVLVRMGNIEQRQEFRKGERSTCTYITPYGAMEMSVATSDVTVAFANSSGSVAIAYELEIEGRWQSSNQLAITIREEKKTNGH